MAYQSHVDADRRAMLARLGVESVDALFGDIPESLRDPAIAVPEGLSEPELFRLFADAATANRAGELVCFLGAGAYDHYIPAAVDELAGRNEFYTGYTPYQPEMTQGVLQAIYEYQTAMCELTGLDVSNASLYDGGSATWEALIMAEREARAGRFLLASSVHPNVRRAVASYAAAAEFGVAAIGGPTGRLSAAELEAALAEAKASALVVQLPTCLGEIIDYSELAEVLHRHRALLIIVANPMALALVKSPGEMGADICVGDGQPLGIPLQYGGPYVGFLTARERLVRRMPGRIVGATVDAEGNRGFVLTLQAREQHIRRDKATSNVCTNQALMALRTTIYLTLVGRDGLRRIAEVCLRHADYLRDRLLDVPGAEPISSGPHFCEFAIRLPNAAARCAAAVEAGYLAGLPLEDWDPALANGLLVCATEKRTRAQMDGLVQVLSDSGD